MAIRFYALRRLVASVKKLDSDKMLKTVLSNSSIQHDILDQNRLDQLYERGVDAEGNELGEYSPKTIRHKKQKGQRYDHVTLSDTQKFYESFRFVNDKKDFKIKADTIKKGEANPDFGKIIQLSNGKFVTSTVKGEPDTDLMDRYGKIIGLDNESISHTRDWVLGPLRKEMKKGIKWK